MTINNEDFRAFANNGAPSNLGDRFIPQFEQLIKGLQDGDFAYNSKKLVWDHLGLGQNTFLNWKAAEKPPRVKVGQLAVICHRVNAEPLELLLPPSTCNAVKNFMLANNFPTVRSTLSLIEKVLGPNSGTFDRVINSVLTECGADLTWFKHYRSALGILHGGVVFAKEDNSRPSTSGNIALTAATRTNLIQDCCVNPNHWGDEPTVKIVANCAMWLMRIVRPNWTRAREWQNLSYIYATTGVASEIYFPINYQNRVVGLLNTHYYEPKSDGELEAESKRISSILEDFDFARVADSFAERKNQAIYKSVAELNMNGLNAKELFAISTELENKYPYLSPKSDIVEIGAALKKSIGSRWTMRRKDRIVIPSAAIRRRLGLTRPKSTVSELEEITQVYCGVISSKAFFEVVNLTLDLGPMLQGGELEYGFHVGSSNVYMHFRFSGPVQSLAHDAKNIFNMTAKAIHNFTNMSAGACEVRLSGGETEIVIVLPSASLTNCNSRQAKTLISRQHDAIEEYYRGKRKSLSTS